jgi:serine-type D-Ala-D-Ala carboxypeptidase/endopeptidase (penicillin-binding protein 4)
MRQKIFLTVTVVFYLSTCFDFAFASRIKKRKIKKMFTHSAIVNDHFTGFALYDLDNKKMVYELNADKYFIPASNTKLFTYYTCLKMLGDSIPALKYVIRHDSLIFWGTGDPSFLHPALKGVKAYNFLKASGKKLFFSAANYTGDLYGRGWAWDDYNDYYQAEITSLPVQDNLAFLYPDKKNGSLSIQPLYFKKYLKPDSGYHPHSFKVKRSFLDNSFVYPITEIPKNFSQQIPWKASGGVISAILTDTLNMPVTELQVPLDTSAKTLYDAIADTVYKYMLQPSDNFIAEQLLLVCSSTKFKTLNTDSVINYSKAHFLNDLPDVPKWVDGSGLSRQNLFTPRSIIALLQKILIERNETLVHSLLPAGGVVGTIKDAYKTDNGLPFVWAKTGALSNNYNQSGYLVTKKGKRLAFSFMNNNFMRPSKEIKDEMVKIITFLHDNY